jgi:hypothetical protein
MKRWHDWPRRLADFIEERRGAPFGFGCNDCCLFAADAVQRMTGKDFAEEYRGYETPLEAARLLERHGGVCSIAQDFLGESIAPEFAQRGDVVAVLTDDNRKALGICLGENYAGPGPRGLVFRPMAEAVMAWRV